MQRGQRKTVNYIPNEFVEMVDQIGIRRNSEKTNTTQSYKRQEVVESRD